MAFGVDLFEPPVSLVLLHFAALCACDVLLLNFAKLLLCCDCIVIICYCMLDIFACYFHCNVCLLVHSLCSSKTVPCRRYIHLQPQISRPRC